MDRKVKALGDPGLCEIVVSPDAGDTVSILCSVVEEIMAARRSEVRRSEIGSSASVDVVG